MSRKKNASNNKLKYFMSLQAVNFAVYCILFLILCAVCVAADIEKKYIYYVSLAFISISSFIAGFFGGIKNRKNGMVYGLINALPLNIIFIFISMIYNSFTVDTNLPITVILGLLMSAVGGIVSVNIRLK